MSQFAIEVENLGKLYTLGVQNKNPWVPNVVSQWYGKLARKKVIAPKMGAEEFWALKDVSFTVKKGEVLGIIGRNGAGKSTLLKILARITDPTTGRAVMRGRVAALLQVGTGFHQDLTGRENIYLNGTMLGLNREEIDRNFDEIVDFADVEKFLDSPIKYYSSGMKARLGFAVISCLESDILMLDEVLSVGDQKFRQKSLKRANDMVQDGRTVLFVSHNLAMVQRICDRVILIDEGKISDEGSAESVVGKYLHRQLSEKPEYIWTDEQRARITGQVSPVRLTMRNMDGEKIYRFARTAPIKIEFEYDLLEDTSNLKIGVTLGTSSGELFCVAWENHKESNYKRSAGRYVSSCVIPPNMFGNTGFSLGVQTGIHGAQKTFRDPDLLRLFIDASTTVGDYGRSLISPVFDWETEKVGTHLSEHLKT